MNSEVKFDPLASSHLEEMFGLWSDFETVKFTNWSHTPTVEICVERLTRCLAYYAKDSLHFGPFVVRDPSGQFLGLAGADRGPAACYEVWYILSRPVWGKGWGNRTLGELLSLMKISGRASRAIAMAAEPNIASWRLLERHGFRRESVVSEGFQKHGLSADLRNYSRAMEAGR